MNRIIQQASKRQRQAGKTRWTWIRQAVSGIKDIRIGRHEDFFSLQFVQYTAQIIVLITTRSFLLYVLFGCLPMLAANVLSTYRVNKLYPFLREEDKTPLPEQFQREVTHDICTMTMQKIGGVLVNDTDNIILSSMISVASVAQYSNYNLFCRGVSQILTACFNGINNSVGNLGATPESDEQVR